MNLKVIACKVLQREISLISASCENFIDITYIRQGFHNEPEKLREILQNEIDLIDEGNDNHTCSDKPFDAILIGYGLCSNGISGISSKKYPLVIPKAHDCITLLLGSKEGYKSYFDKNNGGLYWYSCGWNENTIMPSELRYKVIYEEYEEKYGEDNAQYLMEMEQNWMKEYSKCTYINWKDLEFPKQIEYTRQCAEFLKWNFDLLQGDKGLISNFLNGNWKENEFIIVPPNCCVVPSHDDEILTYQTK